MSQNKEASASLEWLTTVDTPTLSNAIETFRVRPRSEGFAPCDVQCIFPEFGRMCGWAVTAQVETVTEANRVGERHFAELFEAVQASPKPAVVAFQEIGARPELAAHCGEVMSTVFQRLGAIGLVTDSAVRDIPEVRALKFHYFARGRVASHANFRIVRVGGPIHLMGMVIQPGDLLHGDENGLIQIPAECLSGLPAAVDQVRTRERMMLDLARGPQFELSELLRRFFH